MAAGGDYWVKGAAYQRVQPVTVEIDSIVQPRGPKGCWLRWLDCHMNHGSQRIERHVLSPGTKRWLRPGGT